jgi:hypothetical protein
MPAAKLPPQRLTDREWAIAQLPGLSETDQAKLADHHIETTFDLLRQTKTPLQRQTLAIELQVHLHHVNKWAALADLARVPAVGCQYCGLLLHAGVSSVAQLAQVSVPRLHRQILKLQVAMMQRPDLCPGVETIAVWVQQAQVLSARRSGLR